MKAVSLITGINRLVAGAQVTKGVKVDDIFEIFVLIWHRHFNEAPLNNIEIGAMTGKCQKCVDLCIAQMIDLEVIRFGERGLIVPVENESQEINL